MPLSQQDTLEEGKGLILFVFNAESQCRFRSKILLKLMRKSDNLLNMKCLNAAFAARYS